MKLIRISLVNWYLFNPIDLDIEGNTVFTGINGVGKSTVLDAIQTVLFGGNLNLTKLNAKASLAGSKSKRTIKSYCLGPNVRPECYSYLSLSFSGKKGVKNLIICIEAREDEPKEIIRTRAICHSDRALSCHDFITQNNDQWKAIPFTDIDAHLKLRGFELTNFQHAKDYIANMAIELGPHRSTGETIDPSILSSTLSKSLSIGENVDVSEFVKNFILEEKPLSISSMVNARKQYHEILAHIEQDKKNLEELHKIKTKLSNALSQTKKSVAYYWLHFERVSGQLEIELETLREQRHEIYAKYLTGKQEYASQKKQILEIRTEIERLKNLLNDDTGNALVSTLKGNIYTWQLEQQPYNTKRRERYNAIDCYVYKPEDIKRLFSDIDTSLITQLNMLISDVEVDKVDFDSVEELVSQLPPVLKSIQEVAESLFIESSNRLSALNARQGALKTLINDAKDGKKTLSARVETLINKLAEKGIEAKPVSQLATISDKDWQPAIEALLGGNTDALIVDPAHEVDAIRTYRNLRNERGNDLYGLTIVRTSRSHQWLNRYKPNSAAELVESDDEYALAYLHHQLGQFILVETEEQMRDEERSITKDGMLATPSKTTKNKLPEELKLVKDVRQNIPVWKKERNDNAIEINTLSNDRDTYQKHQNNARDLVIFLEDEKHQSFCQLQLKIDEFEGFILDAYKQIDDIDLTTYNTNEVKLSVEKDKLKVYTGDAEKRGAQEVLYNELAALRNSYMNNRDKCIVINTSKLEEATQARKSVEGSTFYDAQFVDTLSEKVEEGDELELKARTTKQRADNAFSDGIILLKSYLGNSDPVDKFVDDSFDFSQTNLSAIVAVVNKQYKHIEENSLAEHRSLAATAVAEMNDSFRADVINKLKSSFDELSIQFKMINASLRKNPFHGSLYQFKWSAKKEYESLIKYIEQVSTEEASNVGDIFDNTPIEVKNEIDALMSSNTEGSSLEDYRSYFNYNVGIKDTTTGKESLLTEQIGTGSGGELQSPVYVTLASALSSAWKTLKKPGESVGLTLIDEAFNNLSEDNLISAKTFMNDVGLQLICAAPSDKEPVFSIAMDTIHYISKEGDAIDVTTHVITKKGQQVLMVANPNLNPALVDQRLIASS